MSKSQQRIIIGIDLAALTAYLHPQGKTEKTDSQHSYIPVPIKIDWRTLKL